MNTTKQVETIGLVKSILILIKSFGRLSISVIVPAPTSRFPDHLKTEPIPDAAPSKVFSAAGSNFAHGDHACHLWNSLTKGKISAAVAFIFAERTTLNSSGRVYATIRKNYNG